jgi:hypothetical protein
MCHESLCARTAVKGQSRIVRAEIGVRGGSDNLITRFTHPPPLYRWKPRDVRPTAVLIEHQPVVGRGRLQGAVDGDLDCSR